MSHVLGSPACLLSSESGFFIHSEHTMKITLIVATVIAIVPPALVFLMKDIRFGEQQNDVERRAPDGESLASEDFDLEKK